MPEPICQHLRKLQDDVPPMPANEVEATLKRELRVNSLGDVFEWIDLEKPLGSASIAQVHKAKLRRYVTAPSTAWNILTIPVRLCRALYSTSWPAPDSFRPVARPMDARVLFRELRVCQRGPQMVGSPYAFVRTSLSCLLCAASFCFRFARTSGVVKYGPRCTCSIAAANSESGSATVSVVTDVKGRASSQAEPRCKHIVRHGETGWDVANMHGVSLENLRDANKDNKINFDSLIEGDAVQLPSGCLTSSVVPACCCAVPARLADVCLR